MPDKKPRFSTAEFQRRLGKTRDAMQANEIDVLYVQDPSNMAWLTGYDGWSFYVHQGVLVFHDADPIWWGRGQDAQGAYRTVWMEDDRVWAYADHFVQSTVRHPMQDLAAKLSDLGYGSARIGVELDNYYFSAKAYLALTDALPEAHLVDATALVNWQRAVKSAEEVACIRKAATISERMWDGVMERAEVGLPKHHLVAEIYRDAIRGVGEAWGDYPAIVPLLPSGSDASAPHLTWDDRPLAQNEGTFFELSGCYQRYHAPFCRTLFFGEPPKALRNAEEALVAGLEAGLAVAKARSTCGDVARALKSELAKRGIKKDTRVGYPIGLSYPPDWGERTMSLREEDDTVLEAGMTFHFMPGLWLEDFGLEITETIMIREGQSAECLCNRPRKLFVK